MGAWPQVPTDDAPYIFTAVAFEITEQNRLTPDPVDPNFSVQTGEVRLRGVEFEGSGRMHENTDLIVSYSYTEAEITESNDPAEIGRQLEGVPYHLAAAWILRTFALGAEMEAQAGFGLRYVGETRAYAPLATIIVPAETLADASLGLNLQSWRLQSLPTICSTTTTSPPVSAAAIASWERRAA